MVQRYEKVEEKEERLKVVVRQTNKWKREGVG
jgi:hypothetical protein